MSPIRLGGLLAVCLLSAVVALIAPADVYPQAKPPAEETDNIVPVAASVQALRNVQIPLGATKLKVSSIEYAQQGTMVYLLPVWVVARVDLYNSANRRWEEFLPSKALPAKVEPMAPRLRVQLANLLAQEDTRMAVEKRLRDHVARGEGVKPEQVKLRSPTFNPRGFRIALAAPGSSVDVGEVLLSRTVIVPPAVAEDNGSVIFDLLPENIAGLQAVNAEPVVLRGTYLKLSGQMKARFEKQQYLANFQAVQAAVTSMQNDLKSSQPTGQAAPDVFVQVPVGGRVAGRAAVTEAFSQYLVGSISIREGANVNLGLLNELAERVLGRILTQVELAQTGDAKRVAVMLGNMATLSATVGEIKTLAKQTRAERENRLKTALDDMDALRTGQKSEYKGSVGVRFGLLGGKVEAAYANATEEGKATRRKQEFDTLHRGLDELAKHFDGRLPSLTGIRFDQKALDESVKVVQVELQGNSFTTGWSQHDWTGIKLTTTVGLAVSPELLLRQVEAAEGRYAQFERLLGTPAKLKELQELLRLARTATEQAKATADRVAEMEKRGTPTEVERRLNKLELSTFQIPRTTLKGHTSQVHSVSFSPAGKTVATASEDKTARLWDAATGAEKLVLKGHTGPVQSVTFSPDGKTVATASDDQTARLWDAATGTEKLVLKGHTGLVRSVSFSPDGKTVATGGWDNTARLWDTATAAEKLVFRHRLFVSAVSFSADGKTVATGSHPSGTGPGMAHLWDTATGAERIVLKGHTMWVTTVSCSPTGHMLVTGGWDSARLWDAATGAERRVLLKANDNSACHVRSVSFSPDGNTVATSSNGQTAHLWDAVTGVERLVLKGHPALSLSFSPDGKTLATGGWDNMARLWDLYP